MTCVSSTAPINISSKGYTDDCSLKCLYKYDYSSIPSTTITNEGNYLAVSYDKVNINYNNNKLQVQGIRIYTPSLHTFNGVRADGEMVITHMGMGTSLLVCIPIVVSSNKTVASQSLEFLVSQAVSRTPNAGEKAVVSVKDFSLNTFIPRNKSFFSYEATLPYSPCNGTHQYIVFMPENSPVFISTETMALLRKIIMEHDSTIKPEVDYFYNKRGAIFLDPSSDGTDDIYIDCQPTGSSGEPIPVPSSSDTHKKSESKPFNFKNNRTASIVLIVISAVIILGGLMYFLIPYIRNWIKTRAATRAAAIASATSGATPGSGAFIENPLFEN